jgi:hypothetical protein
MTPEPMPENQHIPHLDSITAKELWTLLKQPGVLHYQILRGLLPLSRMQALHLASATDYDSMKVALEAAQAEIVQLREAVAMNGQLVTDGAHETAMLRAENAWLREALRDSLHYCGDFSSGDDYDTGAAFVQRVNALLATNETPTA